MRERAKFWSRQEIPSRWNVRPKVIHLEVSNTHGFPVSWIGRMVNTMLCHHGQVHVIRIQSTEKPDGENSVHLCIIAKMEVKASLEWFTPIKKKVIYFAFAVYRYVWKHKQDVKFMPCVISSFLIGCIRFHCQTGQVEPKSTHQHLWTWQKRLLLV